MDDKQFSSLPFLTRSMLGFEHGVSFSLRVWSQSVSNNVIQIRGFTKEGPFQFTHTTDSSVDTKQETFRLPDIPIFVSAHDATNTLRHGRVFIRTMLRVNGDDLMGLFSGYVSAEQAPSWPTTFNSVVRPGAGFMTIMTSANPAAGAQANIATGSNYMTLVHMATITLVTNANVADRLVKLQLTDVAGATFTAKAMTVQAASLTKTYTFAKFGAASDLASGSYISGAIPDNFWVGPVGNIGTVTDNMQAGDDFGILSVLVEQYFDRGSF